MPEGVQVKVLDFGIAKLARDDTADQKTRTGTLLGTPAYMSPEQCRGASQVDHRSDIYSLGCILYELTCGRRPFDGEGVGEILGKQIYEEPPRPRELVPTLPSAPHRHSPATIVVTMYRYRRAMASGPTVKVWPQDWHW